MAVNISARKSQVLHLVCLLSRSLSKRRQKSLAGSYGQSDIASLLVQLQSLKSLLPMQSMSSEADADDGCVIRETVRYLARLKEELRRLQEEAEESSQLQRDITQYASSVVALSYVNRRVEIQIRCEKRRPSLLSDLMQVLEEDFDLIMDHVNVSYESTWAFDAKCSSEMQIQVSELKERLWATIQKD